MCHCPKIFPYITFGFPTVNPISQYPKPSYILLPCLHQPKLPNIHFHPFLLPSQKPFPSKFYTAFISDMEASMIGCSQAKIGSINSAIRELGFFNPQIFLKKNQIFFDMKKRCTKARIQFAVKATATATIQPEIAKPEKFSYETVVATEPEPEDGVQLFVGLPLDTVSECNSVNHVKAITAGLKALKLLGCDGIEFPVWWGIVEKEAMGKYDWSGYLALAKMVQDQGLKLRVSLCFHASKVAKIPLPQWVSKIGETQPDIFFTDRSGKHYKECLSLSVDDLPVLDGKTPMQVYEEFLNSFESSFSPFMGSTITDISVGLGPDGELRYPSNPSSKSSGAGEFQCYDKHMLNNLKQHAQVAGNVYWGLGGPHDAPTYHESPIHNAFFKENGGSWESSYGNFFLSWYSNELIVHGERLLSLASKTLKDTCINISGKVPLVHSWYKLRSHPSELTAGFYNTSAKDGYDALAEMFARNSCGMVLLGMDLSDQHQPESLLSSPELLISQIKKACTKYGVKVYGENSALGAPGGLEQIKVNLSRDDVVVSSFIYQRMGAYFFSPDHFPSFTEFIRSLDQPELHLDDMPSNHDEDVVISSATVAEPKKDLQMQEA